MMKIRIIAIALALSILAPVLLVASEHARVMSIMRAIPDDHIYKVNINKIDGKDHLTQMEYTVKPGEHTFSVSLILETQWEPKLNRAKEYVYVKEIDFTLEAGKTYQLAAKVDPDASRESIEDGSFWEPIIYKD